MIALDGDEEQWTEMRSKLAEYESAMNQNADVAIELGKKLKVAVEALNVARLDFEKQGLHKQGYKVMAALSIIEDNE
jgi:hypothetical protein